MNWIILRRELYNGYKIDVTDVIFFLHISYTETETKKRKRYEATNIEGPQIQTGIKKPSKNGNPESFSRLLKTSGQNKLKDKNNGLYKHL